MSKDERNNNVNQREANCHIIGSKQLVIDGCVYQIHPIYNLYAVPKNEKIIHTILKTRSKYWISNG